MSQHLISWIQVGGLVLGLYGFFFLSYDNLGGRTGPWFAALLPATAVSIGVVVFANLYNTPSTNPVLLSTQHDAGNLDQFRSMLPLYGLLGFMIGYAVSVYFQLDPKATGIPRVRGRFQALRVIGAFIFVSLMGAGIGALVYLTAGGSPTGLLAVGGAWFLFASGSAFMTVGPTVLTKKSLPKWGFALTAIAILTQFIPPVLDVLNIAITKP